MEDIHNIIITTKAMKDLAKVPLPIAIKLQAWIDLVYKEGLREARKVPGFHDEPLRGKRQGQRSIRLNRAYRAIYTIDDSGTVHFVEILEVNKHDY